MDFKNVKLNPDDVFFVSEPGANEEKKCSFGLGGKGRGGVFGNIHGDDNSQFLSLLYEFCLLGGGGRLKSYMYISSPVSSVLSII